ncbi:MAG: hypothetical protein QM765_13025 [Myxococcales bacterium]
MVLADEPQGAAASAGEHRGAVGLARQAAVEVLHPPRRRGLAQLAAQPAQRRRVALGDVLQEADEALQFGQGQGVEEVVAPPVALAQLLDREREHPAGLEPVEPRAQGLADAGDGARREALQDAAQGELGVGRPAGEAGLDVGERARDVGEERVDDGRVRPAGALGDVEQQQAAQHRLPARARLEERVGDARDLGDEDLVRLGLHLVEQVGVQLVHVGEHQHRRRLVGAHGVEDVVGDEVRHPRRALGDDDAVEEAGALEVGELGRLGEEVALLGRGRVVEAALDQRAQVVEQRREHTAVAGEGLQVAVQPGQVRPEERAGHQLLHPVGHRRRADGQAVAREHLQVPGLELDLALGGGDAAAQAGLEPGAELVGGADDAEDRRGAGGGHDLVEERVAQPVEGLLVLADLAGDGLALAHRRRDELVREGEHLVDLGQEPGVDRTLLQRLRDHLERLDALAQRLDLFHGPSRTVGRRYLAVSLTASPWLFEIEPHPPGRGPAPRA